jgi:glycosyltransferase involved in cell wall biosynthesis
MNQPILHITEDHSPRNTGITTLLESLTRALRPFAPQAIVATGPPAVTVGEGVQLTALPSEGRRNPWQVGGGARAVLPQAVGAASVIHLHGLWMWIQWAAARQAQRAGVPFVVSPHGMLQNWMWQRQRWPHRLKKWLYWRGVAYPAFRHARAIHALSPQEASEAAPYFPGQAIHTLPAGIDLAAIDNLLTQLPAAPPERYFLFVGRLTAIKNVEGLLHAFAALPDAAFRLKIAGPPAAHEAAYAAQLPELARSLGIANRVDFLGAVDGLDKWQLYRNAWACCLPSHTEVLARTNLEAAAAATPVITTVNTGLIPEWDRRGGQLIRCDQAELNQAILSASQWSAAERQQRGQNLRQLIEAEYSWQALAPRWLDFYTSLAS